MSVSNNCWLSTSTTWPIITIPTIGTNSLVINTSSSSFTLSPDTEKAYLQAQIRVLEAQLLAMKVNPVATASEPVAKPTDSGKPGIPLRALTHRKAQVGFFVSYCE